MDSRKSNEEVVDDLIKELNLNDDRKKDENQDTLETSNETIPIITLSDEVQHEELHNNLAHLDMLEDIDEEELENREKSLSDALKEKYRQEALTLKMDGNNEFLSSNYFDSINLYTKALNICPPSYKNDRSIFYCNRAAAKIKVKYNETAIYDCTKAIELNPNYLKAYIRRAKLYEASDKLDESLKDFTKILELDPANGEARAASVRLPPKINERNEKLKEEMMGKLKDLGNMVLKPFGLSTENFKLQQDSNTGSYSINFQQARKS